MKPQNVMIATPIVLEEGEEEKDKEEEDEGRDDDDDDDDNEIKAEDEAKKKRSFMPGSILLNGFFPKISGH
jgi:hypothetical protein